MLFVDQYLTSARNLLDEAERQPQPVKGALQRLSAEYARRAVEGLQASNDNIAMGDARGLPVRTPRAH